MWGSGCLECKVVLISSPSSPLPQSWATCSPKLGTGGEREEEEDDEKGAKEGKEEEEEEKGAEEEEERRG